MDIAPYIDHTVLKPETTDSEIERLCREARESSFAAVCVPPVYVRYARQLLQGTSVKIATVVGFPFGYSCTSAKLAEIDQALLDGADELDVVHNLAHLKNGAYNLLEKEIAACIQPVHAAGKTLKLIIESGILSDDEIKRCCELYKKHNVDFLKTSTGYAPIGATVHAVELIRANSPDRMGIKASGGIRTFSFAKELIEAGATRLGCSASMTILQQSKID